MTLCAASSRKKPIAEDAEIAEVRREKKMTSLIPTEKCRSLDRTGKMLA
jgi:hypothetical protein